MDAVASAYGEPYDDSVEYAIVHPSLSDLEKALITSVINIRKFLITRGLFNTATIREFILFVVESVVYILFLGK